MAMDSEKSQAMDLEASNTLVTLGSKRKSRPPSHFSELGPFIGGGAATGSQPKSQPKKRPVKRRLDFPQSVVPVSQKKSKKDKKPKGIVNNIF